ncbi:hypothetical protein GGX14DRAFT_545457 [Mycena pura]|uniref:Major facilitator superfamily (MFS) profile domain-containing protein n=1 Tax=Mycena pura TaxID=153505 RepID=A0AAD6Y5C4_9AGAR|nr:hypothetical protein GGX14DRAFT_545457 [Mycena pura]
MPALSHDTFPKRVCHTVKAPIGVFWHTVPALPRQHRRLVRLAPAPAAILRDPGRRAMFVSLTHLRLRWAGGFYFPLFYLQLDAVTHGVRPALAFDSLVILNASSFVGRLAPGLLAQRLGVVNIILTASGCGAVLLLCMIALKTFASVVTLGVIFGFWIGVFVTLMAPLVAVLTPDMGELGLRIGVTFGVVGIAGLVGPPINGALLTAHNHWWRPALFSGLMASVGFGPLVATAVGVRRRAAAAAEPVAVAEKTPPVPPAAGPADGSEL